MNWADIILVTIIYMIVIVAQSLYQSKQFSKDLKISHFWHGVYYAMFCALMGGAYILVNGWRDGIVVGIYGAFMRMAFFDSTLNAIRGKQLLYNDSDPDPESIVDWWENKTFKLNELGGKRRLLILKMSYLIVWAAYLILILIYAIDKKL